MTSRKNHGFSLLELMMVILVGAVLAVLAMPAFRTYIARTNLSQAANGALVAFNVARQESIKRNTYVRVDPVTCNGVTSWAYGGFVWVPTNPTTSTPPTTPNLAASPTLPIISGAPTASGSDCSNGNKITATPSVAAMTVCYTGSGRVNLNTAAAACTTSSSTATTAQEGGANGLGTSAYSIKFCDSSLVVPNGPAMSLSLGGRVSIQPKVTCP